MTLLPPFRRSATNTALVDFHTTLTYDGPDFDGVSLPSEVCEQVSCVTARSVRGNLQVRFVVSTFAGPVAVVVAGTEASTHHVWRVKFDDRRDLHALEYGAGSDPSLTLPLAVLKAAATQERRARTPRHADRWRALADFTRQVSSFLKRDLAPIPENS